MIREMTIIGEGRRGNGEIILGRPGCEVDFSAPLAPVLAYGAVETNLGTISITIREAMDDQISAEIVSHRSDEVPPEFEEYRRWTYSIWSPGDACPQCMRGVREISMPAGKETHEHVVLALCANDRRLWVYEESTQVNRLIPTTNFYNELMLHKNIRDPKRALDSKLLFTGLDSFSDGDLTYAFLTYNKLKTKVHIDSGVETESRESKGFLKTLKKMISGGSS